MRPYADFLTITGRNFNIFTDSQYGMRQNVFGRYLQQIESLMRPGERSIREDMIHFLSRRTLMYRAVLEVASAALFSQGDIRAVEDKARASKLRNHSDLPLLLHQVGGLYEDAWQRLSQEVIDTEARERNMDLSHRPDLQESAVLHHQVPSKVLLCVSKKRLNNPYAISPQTEDTREAA